MLFLKNLLLRNFQGCCLLFNYQGSSLFLLIRSSSDILSRRFSLVKNSHPVPQWPLGLFFSSVCLSDKWYLITGKVNCQCFFCFLFFSHNSDNSLLFLLTISCCSYLVLYFAQYKTAAFKNSAHPDTSSS